MSDARDDLAEALGGLPAETDAIRAIEDACQMPTYAKLPIALVRGEGSWVWDADGTRYLDLYGGHAVALTGHCHPRVVAALRAQAGRLLFFSNVVYNDVRAAAVKALTDIAPEGLRSVFLCNSGAEANETALKIARKHTGRMRVVSMHEGFHGRTLGALGATGMPNYRDPAYPIPTEHTYIPFGDAEALEAALGDDVAAVMLEPIPSMGGIRTADKAYFQALRTACDAHGALLIFDEVQTGCGITGTAWAFQQLGVLPDVVAFGKKTQVCGVMAGGRVDEIADNVFAVSSRINSTWGGNLVDMVRSRRILEVIETDGLFARAAERGRYLGDRLEDLAAEFPGLVGDVRGRGLMRAFSMPTAAQRDSLIAGLWDRAVIMLGCGPDSVRFRPALTVSRDEIDDAVDAVRAVLSAMWVRSAG